MPRFDRSHAVVVHAHRGVCDLVRATVNKSGQAVPDGTSVQFTTDFGIFLENGLNTVSKTTSAGTADVTLGSTSSGGAAHVKADLRLRAGLVDRHVPGRSLVRPLHLVHLARTGSARGAIP